MDTVRFWVARDGCSPEPERRENSSTRDSTYSECKDGTGVVLLCD